MIRISCFFLSPSALLTFHSNDNKKTQGTIVTLAMTTPNPVLTDLSFIKGIGNRLELAGQHQSRGLSLILPPSVKLIFNVQASFFNPKMQLRPKSPFQAICSFQSQMFFPWEWLQFPDLNTWLFKIHSKGFWSSVSTISQRKRKSDTMVMRQTSIWITDSLTPLKVLFSPSSANRTEDARTINELPWGVTELLCLRDSEKHREPRSPSWGSGNGDQFAKHSSETSSHLITKLASSVKWYGTQLESLNTWTLPSNFDVVRMYNRKSSVRWQPLQFGPHRLSHLVVRWWTE